MSPSKLRVWLQAHGEPVSIREIEGIRQKETGTFAERQIRKSMKALETAGLVEYELSPQGAKLWKLTPAGDAEATEPQTSEVAAR